MKSGVVCMVNEGPTFSVARGDSSRAYPKILLLDTRAQAVMLGMRLANKLGLVPQLGSVFLYDCNIIKGHRATNWTYKGAFAPPLQGRS